MPRSEERGYEHEGVVSIKTKHVAGTKDAGGGESYGREFERMEQAECTY